MPSCQRVYIYSIWSHRFSGLSEEHFVNVDTTLKDVQAILLNMFQEDTILIGHSLNSDLVALKVGYTVSYSIPSSNSAI